MVAHIAVTALKWSINCVRVNDVRRTAGWHFSPAARTMACVLAIITLTGKEMLIQAADATVISMPGNANSQGKLLPRLTEQEESLLAEYRENYLRLWRFYNNITIEAREEAFLPGDSQDAGLVSSYIREYTFRANGGNHYRMDGSQLDPADSSQPLDTRVGIITPSESFWVNRNVFTGKYFLKAHGKDRQRYLKTMSSFCFQVAPFSAGAKSLGNLLLEECPGRVIEKVAVTDPKNGIVQVSLLIKRSDEDWSRYVIHFYRNHSWAVRDAQRESIMAGKSHIRNVMKQRCGYRGEQEGVPLLHECTIEEFVKEVATDIEKPVKRQVYEVKSIVPGAVALSEFDVHQLIPVAGKAIKARPFPYFRFGAMSLGAVLLILGIYLRRKRRLASA